jgi:putative flippase GtrA
MFNSGGVRFPQGQMMKFFRFCVVGAAGFIVEAGLLTIIVDNFILGPFWARWISFPTAVIITFALNRHWSFADSPRQPILSSLAAYLGVQSAGLLCNLLVYTAAIAFLPAPFNEPITALAVAAGVALLVNYVGSKKLVFEQSRMARFTNAGAPRSPSEHADLRQGSPNGERPSKRLA